MFRRSSAASVAALIVVAVAAQPAFALGWGGDPFTGKVGAFAGPSGAEVVCRYNGAGRLRSVTVKPLTMWGNYDEPTVVGQRYLLRQAKLGAAGRLVYRSPLKKDLATKTIAADEFRSSRFYVYENLPGESAYYVALAMRWYDSSETIEGRAAPLTYDRYLLKKGTESRWSNACVFDYDVEYWQGG